MLHQCQYTPHVQIKYFAVFSLCYFRDTTDRFHASIVKCHIKATKALHRQVYQCFHIFLSGHITLEEHCTSSRSKDGGYNFLTFGLPATREDNFSSRAMAVSLPMPDVAPVTITTLSVKDDIDDINFVDCDLVSRFVELRLVLDCEVNVSDPFTQHLDKESSSTSLLLLHIVCFSILRNIRKSTQDDPRQGHKLCIEVDLSNSLNISVCIVIILLDKQSLITCVWESQSEIPSIKLNAGISKNVSTRTRTSISISIISKQTSFSPFRSLL